MVPTRVCSKVKESFVIIIDSWKILNFENLVELWSQVHRLESPKLVFLVRYIKTAVYKELFDSWPLWAEIHLPNRFLNTDALMGQMIFSRSPKVIFKWLNLDPVKVQKQRAFLILKRWFCTKKLIFWQKSWIWRHFGPKIKIVTLKTQMNSL